MRHVNRQALIITPKPHVFAMLTRQRPDRRNILDEWIEYVILNPEKEEVQLDGRMRRWAKIAAFENRWLRVILLEDGETVHNAFFDRDFGG